MTAHGDVITTGSQDVVIGGKPAADMHAYPMVETDPVRRVRQAGASALFHDGDDRDIVQERRQVMTHFNALSPEFLCTNNTENLTELPVEFRRACEPLAHVDLARLLLRISIGVKIPSLEAFLCGYHA
jgi:hypothetical protein